MTAPCACPVSTWANATPTTTWKGMDRMRGSHHFQGCPMFTTADQLQKDRELHRLKFPEWKPVAGANPIDGQGYWVACASPDGERSRLAVIACPEFGHSFTAIGFWDSRASTFRWNSGGRMNSVYAYAEIDFPAPPEKEKA